MSTIHSYSSGSHLRAVLATGELWDKINRMIYRREQHDVKREIWHLRDDTLDDFIKQYLKDAAQEDGVFNHRKDSKTIIQYRCDMFSRSKNAKQEGEVVDDTESAIDNMGSDKSVVSCNAYISFNPKCYEGMSCVVVRKKLKHNGHDVTSHIVNRRYQRMDPLLRAFIEEKIEENTSTNVILLLADDWIKQNDHKHDSDCHLSRADIYHIRSQMKKLRGLRAEDEATLEALCKGKLSSSICLYQKKTSEEPLMIVYQNKYQRQMMVQHGRDVMYLDSAYKGVTYYGCSLYAMLVADKHSRGTPVCFFITTSTNADTLIACLRAIRIKTPHFSPHVIMMEKDSSEITAVKEVFPNTVVLLSWYHITQTISRWSDRETTKAMKTKMLTIATQLHNATSEETFDVLLAEARNSGDLNQNCKDYLDHYAKLKAMWTLYGRHKLQGSYEDVECIFSSVKKYWLKYMGIRKLEDLLCLLDGDFNEYTSYLRQPIELVQRALTREEPNRANNASAILAKEQAASVLKHGLCDQVQILDEVNLQMRIPDSDRCADDRCYIVNLTIPTCTCLHANQQDFCKHIYIAMGVADVKGLSVMDARRSLADTIVQSNNYSIESYSVVVRIGNRTESVDPYGVCTCIAAGQGQICVCVLVAQAVAQVQVDDQEVHLLQTQVQQHSNEAATLLSELLDHARSGNINDKAMQHIRLARQSLMEDKYVVGSKKRRTNCPVRCDSTEHVKEHGYAEAEVLLSLQQTQD